MSAFYVHALDKSNRRRKIKVDAVDATQAADIIRGRGWMVYGEVLEMEGARYNPKTLRVSGKALLMILESACMLLSNGMTIDRVMRAMVGRAHNSKMRFMLASICRQIEDTGQVPEAFDAFPRVFPEAVRGMIRAYHSNGQLEVGMREVCEYFARMEEIKGDVMRGMMIPSIGILAFVMACGVIFGFTIPGYKKNLGEMMPANQLPTITRIFFGISDALVAYPWLVLAGLIVVPALIYYMLGMVWAQKFLTRVANYIPALGVAFLITAIARLCSTYAGLNSVGYRPVECIEMCARSVGHPLVSAALLDVRTRLLANQTLGEAFAAQHKVLPSDFLAAVQIGENNLAAVFKQLAIYYARDAKIRINMAISMMEPGMTVLLGGFAGLAGFAMMSPVLVIIKNLK